MKKTKINKTDKDDEAFGKWIIIFVILCVISLLDKNFSLVFFWLGFGMARGFKI